MQFEKALQGGKSGASIKLIKVDDEIFVRKYLMEPERDRLSIKKQDEFSGVFQTPTIIRQEADFFDQQFIGGNSGQDIYQYASPGAIRHLTKVTNQYLGELLTQQKKIKFNEEKYKSKLSTLRPYCVSQVSQKALALCQSLCEKIEVTLIGPCHGDLTFSNFIIENQIHLIDFLSTFEDSIFKDLSKLNQELCFGWSARHLQGNARTRANQICRYMRRDLFLIKELEVAYSTQILLEDLLTLLRILPYVQDDDQTKAWVNCALFDRMERI